jgi:hypothetical protein
MGRPPKIPTSRHARRPLARHAANQVAALESLRSAIAAFRKLIPQIKRDKSPDGRMLIRILDGAKRVEHGSAKVVRASDTIVEAALQTFRGAFGKGLPKLANADGDDELSRTVAAAVESAHSATDAMSAANRAYATYAAIALERVSVKGIRRAVELTEWVKVAASDLSPIPLAGLLEKSLSSVGLPTLESGWNALAQPAREELIMAACERALISMSIASHHARWARDVWAGLRDAIEPGGAEA